MADSPEAATFSWTTTESQSLLRDVVSKAFPAWKDGPRPSQVECWAYSLEKIPVLLIASTGWGKTSAFYGPLVIHYALLKECPPGLPKPTVKKPVVLVVTPLVELAYNQVKEIQEIGLTAIAITADTLSQAANERRNLYREVENCHYSIVFIGPERLVSKEFNHITRSKGFLVNVILLGIDETHLVDEWGKDFRVAYHQIGVLRKRLPGHVGLVAVTATLAPGRQMDEVRAQLGMKDGNYHLIRLSAERTNVRLIFRELKSGLGGYTFPEIAWAFASGKKVVIYCSSIDLTFRVALYGWELYEASTSGLSRLDYVRIWNSITSRSYNERTLDLFHNNPLTRVIVATVAFGLGMNIKIITDAVNLGLPTTLETLVQQNGRAGRDQSMDARGWTYVERSVMTALQKDPSPTSATPPKATSAKHGKADEMDTKLKSVLTAHINQKCLVASTNLELGNHLAQDGAAALLDCSAARRRLPCSSCAKGWAEDFLSDLSLPGITTTTTTTPNPTAPQRRIRPQLPPPLSQNHRKAVVSHLDNFARNRWLAKSDRDPMLPSSCIWEGTFEKEVLDHFHLLRGVDSVVLYLPRWKYLVTDGPALATITAALNQQIDQAVIKAKEEKAARAKNAKTASSEDKENKPAVGSETAKSNVPSKPLTIRIPSRKNGSTSPHTTRAVLGVKQVNTSTEMPVAKRAC